VAVPFLEFGRLSNFGMAADLQRDRLQRDFDALKSIDGNIASIVYGNALKQGAGAEYDAAALTIQCGWRCYVARKITLDLLFEKFERDLSFYEQHSKSQVEEGDILMREQSLEASWLCRQLADRNRRFARNYAATVIQRCWRLARGKGISSHKPKNAPLRSRKGSNLTVHVPFFPESASSWLMTPKSQYGSYTNSPLVSVVAAESDWDDDDDDCSVSSKSLALSEVPDPDSLLLYQLRHAQMLLFRAKDDLDIQQKIYRLAKNRNARLLREIELTLRQVQDVQNGPKSKSKKGNRGRTFS
jgi:hypothetical protein